MKEIQFRMALIQKGLSQNKLATILGIHPQVLSSIVRGYKKPDESFRDKIAKILDLPQSTLFETKK